MSDNAPSPRSRLRVRYEANVPVATAVLLILVADLALVALHVIAVARGYSSPVLRLDVDRSYGEMFEYLKLTWTVLLLGLIALGTASVRPLAWAPLLVLLLADNGWSLHERVGESATTWIGVSQSAGETLFVLAAYPACIATVALAVRGAEHAEHAERILHRRLTVGVLVLGMFGVGVDVVHHLVIGHPVLDPVIAVVEDGGELVACSLLLLACIAAHVRGSGARVDGAPRLRVS